MLPASFYSSRAWRDLRLRALARDGYRCTAEESDGSRCTAASFVGMHVDHEDETRPLDLDAVRTLCPSHHSILTWMRRRDPVREPALV